MRFHILKGVRTLTHNPDLTQCGLNVDKVYRNLDEHPATEAQVAFRPSSAWFEGDHVCLACVRKTRPSSPKKIQACTDVEAGDWVVLCGCGGVRPYGKACGKDASLPLDRELT